MSSYQIFCKQKIYLHKDIILDFGIKVSKEISEEKLEEILEASEKRRAFERAMYLLDYRDYSYRELFGKLSESYEEDICFYVLKSYFPILNMLLSIGRINFGALTVTTFIFITVPFRKIFFGASLL